MEIADETTHACSSSQFFRPDVNEYLTSVFERAFPPELVTNVIQTLAEYLGKPPPLTTLRINTLLYSREEAIRLLEKLLSEQYQEKQISTPPVIPHPILVDTVIIPNDGPRKCLLHTKRVIVDLHCGLAVMRGADVFAPGVMAAPKCLQSGDLVSVFADMEGKCRRGLAADYEAQTLYVGNGIAVLSRIQLFGSKSANRGTAIKMVDPLYAAPSLNAELSDVVFIQNLPSIVASHVLDPQPGETILDMCASPGGKTTHIATLMRDKGCLIALDKTAPKIFKLKQNVERFRLSLVHCFIFDSTKALYKSANEFVPLIPTPPPYLPESFDRILLDAPCSALGQRPQPICSISQTELMSYPAYQRSLFEQAVGLLRPGGTLVYSTCTFNPEENEAQVAWALKSFPRLHLSNQVPFVGFPGLPGYGIDAEQLRMVQRFGPIQFFELLDLQQTAHCSANDNNALAKDTIAFFVAKFVKV
ncbi:hypothetical protein EMCRGX_G013328 [Ephydatia muelleri]